MGIQGLVCCNLVEGLVVDVNTPKPDCIACVEVKVTVAPFGPASHMQRKKGKLTHIDLWGKYDITSINGSRYYLLMVNDGTQFIIVKFLKLKSQAAEKVIKYMANLKARDIKPCAIRMD